MKHFDFSSFLIHHTENGTFRGLCNARMSAYLTQGGLCYVLDKPLLKGQRELHHRQPRFFGGTDSSTNTVMLDTRVHRLIHCSDSREIEAMLAEINPTEAQLKLINVLRREAHMPNLPRDAANSSAS